MKAVTLVKSANRKKQLSQNKNGLIQWGLLVNMHLKLLGLSWVLFSTFAMAEARLDLNFGTNAGFTTTNILKNNLLSTTHQQTIRQSDGKYLAVGQRSSLDGNSVEIALSRYLTDGSLDPSFGSNGVVYTRSNSKLYPSATLQQKDGQLVVVGTYFNDSDRGFFIARYNLDGSPDIEFGNNGLIRTDINGNDANAFAVIQQDDEKLVIAGSSISSPLTLATLLRLNIDGTIDTSFNGTGITSVYFGASSYVRDVTLQSDGKLIISGMARELGEDYSQFIHARLNQNGTLDETFGIDGFAKADISESNDTVSRVILTNNNRILAAGTSENNFTLVQYLLNGQLDSSFSADGIQTVNLMQLNIGFDVKQHPETNKIYMLGYGNSQEFLLMRFNPDGSLDTSFDSDGMVSINASLRADYGTSLELLPNGKILLSGYSTSIGEEYRGLLVQLNADGSLDNTFANGGIIEKKSLYSLDYAYSSIVQTDGKIIEVGYTHNTGNADMVITRYLADGFLDPSFSNNGILTVDIAGGTDRAYGVVQQANGQLIIAGESYNGSNSDFTLVRVNNDGTVDGIVRTAVGDGYDRIRAITQQADGKLLVAGSSQESGFTHLTLARYSESGVLDPTFGDQGIVVSTILSSNATAFSLTLQSNGQIVVAGSTDSGLTSQVIVKRFETDGTVDNSFNGTGTFSQAIGVNNDALYSVIQQADGKLVMAGYGFGSSNDDFLLVRLNTDGTLDTSFDSDGILFIDFNGGKDKAASILQQDDGKLIISGVSEQNGIDQLVMARIELSGMLDTSFDDDGLLIMASDLGNTFQFGEMSYYQGNYYIPGYSERDFVLAKVTVNPNPILALDNNTLLYIENDQPLAFAASGFIDNSSGSWDGSRLSFTMGNSGGNLLFMEPYFRGNLNLFEGNLLYGSTIIGSVVQESYLGSIVEIFSVDFNANANQALVLQLMQSLRFSYNSSPFRSGSRLINITFNDPVNGSSSDTKKIQVLAQNSLPTGRVIISGAALETETLTASHTLQDDNGLGIISYKWFSENNFLGEGDSFYLGASSIGTRVNVIASYTDNVGYAETVQSASTQVITLYNSEDDYDGDGVSNGQERSLGTALDLKDTDGDGIPDDFEIANGFDPLVDDANDDLDNDGTTNLQEYLKTVNNFNVIRLQNGKVIVLP